MKAKKTILSAVVALSLLGTGAFAQTPKFGASVLADAQGMTLYTFDQDPSGRSNCNGACAAAWPPAAVAASIERASGDFTIVKRDDGTLQWAHKGRPLYRYAGDTRAGDLNGDKQGNVWHVVKAGRPAPSAPAAAPAMIYTY